MLQAGGANPVIDPNGYRAYVDERQKAYEENLERQRAGK
jgi:hypothetical protein